MAYDSEFKTALAEALKGVASVHAVGEEWVSYVGEIPAGGIPYCGQEVTRETYSALWEYVNAKGLVKSESEWQSLNSAQNGNVPYYSSGNGSTTFRMPKIVGYVRGAVAQGESGGYTKEGLPNITGRLDNNFDRNVFNGGADGAFYQESGAGRKWATNDNTATALGEMRFDASRSNAIYGNSSHVTPETSVVLFGVYAFGTVAEAGTLDATTLAAELASVKTNYLPLKGGVLVGSVINDVGDLVRHAYTDGWTSIKGGTSDSTGAYFTAYGKDHGVGKGRAIIGAFDGTSLNSLTVYPDGRGGLNGHEIVTSGKPLVPNYSAGVAIANGFTAPSAGVVCIITWGSSKNACQLVVNGFTVGIYKNPDYNDSTCYAWVGKGDVCTYSNGGSSASATFYPLKMGG